jgi:hypothetical protein
MVDLVRLGALDCGTQRGRVSRVSHDEMKTIADRLEVRERLADRLSNETPHLIIASEEQLGKV